MNNYKDYTGQKFGRLECICFAKKVKYDIYWTCKCECGNIVDIRIKALLTGNTKSCGCLKRETRNIKDHTGQKFGRLECISFARSVKNSTYWTCKCECGNIIDARITSLVSGDTKSCGCLKREMNKSIQRVFKDYTGQKFGRLECMHFAERIEGNTYWTCKCDCGRFIDVRIKSLTNGSKNSCGCLRRDIIDYTGQKFGNLECISQSKKTTHKNIISWRCKCDCGRFIDVRITSLIRGRVKSCGCLNQIV